VRAHGSGPRTVTHRAARLRLPSWRKAARRRPAQVDGGPLLLGRIGRAVAARASEFLTSDAEVTLSPLERKFVSAFNDTRRAWRHVEDERIVWCTADEESQRALLEWVLDGPGASVPTAVEKTIVAECVERLLSASAGSWAEAPVHDIAHEEAWHGVIDVCGLSRVARLELQVRADAGAAIGPAPRVDEVPLRLAGRLGPFRVTIGDLVNLRQGSSLALGVATTSPPALLCIERGPAISGALGVVDGRRAIRLNGGIKSASI
jgi:hypothetical protein